MITHKECPGWQPRLENPLPNCCSLVKVLVWRFGFWKQVQTRLKKNTVWLKTAGFSPPQSRRWTRNVQPTASSSWEGYARMGDTTAHTYTTATDDWRLAECNAAKTLAAGLLFPARSVIFRVLACKACHVVVSSHSFEFLVQLLKSQLIFRSKMYYGGGKRGTGK